MSSVVLADGGERELLCRLMEHVPAMLAYWDSSLHCRYTNPAYERWFGAAPGELIGKHVRDVLGPIYEASLPYIQQVLRGEPQQFERELPNPAGGPARHILANYVPDIVDGVVRGWLVLVTDISEIKRAKIALEESEARFAGIVSTSADAIISIDAEQHIVLFNKSAELMFGWPAAAMIGRPLEMLIPERLRVIHRERVRRFARSRRRSLRIGEDEPAVIGLRKNGEEFPAEGSISKLHLERRMILTVSLRDITERRQAEDERNVFVALLDNAPDFIGIADANGVPIYVNPAGRRMVGLPPNFPIELTTTPDYYPDAERAFAIGVIVRAMVESGYWSGETYFRNWQTEAAIPVFDEHFVIRDPASGRRLGMGTICRDISAAREMAAEREAFLAREREARERAEATSARLRESEERFRLAFDDAPIGMALVALDGRYERVNQALCEIVGYSADELRGLTFQAITHPDYRDADRASAERLIRGEIRRYHTEKRYIRKNGRIVDIQLSVSVLPDAAGAPLYYISQMQDISEEKRLENEQRFLAEIGPVLASSLAYEDTLSRVADLVVRDLADMCIVEVIEDDQEIPWVKVATRDPSKAELRDGLADASADGQHPALLKTAIETRRPVLLQRPSRATVTALAGTVAERRALAAADVKALVAVPLIAQDKLLGAIALVSSTSSHIYAGRDIHLAAQLAERVALSVQNALLYRAARRATQARDDVLAIVAHDLRNPLNTIRMAAGLLGRIGGEPDRRSVKPGEIIERAARRMNHLIQDLLDIASLEAGRLAVELQSVVPEQLVADAVEAHRTLATSASLDVRSAIPGHLPPIWASPDRLLQVFENLIGNAIKFTPRGGHIVVGATPREHEVLFWVSDTGRGIPADDVPRVFDRFWQGHRTRRRGAGLGLPIVKGIVDAHGGRIWVRSTPNEGSTFFFTIPTEKRAPENAHEASDAERRRKTYAL